MDELNIRAIARDEKPKKVRRDGFAPGIIYGDGIKNPISVKFEMIRLKRLLRRLSGNTQIQVKSGEQLFRCIIKEVQKHPVTGEILHIDLQAISENKNVRLRLPVIISGRTQLEINKYLLHVFINEIEAYGPINLMPRNIIIDAGSKKPGEKVTCNDIRIDQQIRLSITKEEVIATITEVKELEVAS